MEKLLMALREALGGVSFKQRQQGEKVKKNKTKNYELTNIWILVKHLTLSHEILIEKLIQVSWLETVVCGLNIG